VGAAAGVLANDTDAENDPLTARLVSGPAHGTLTLNADGSVRYTPAAGFNGVDSFTYQVSDGQMTSDPVTVTLIVNDAPVVTSGNLFVVPQAIDEGGFVELTGTFGDANAQAHTVTIDWGDGSTPDTLSLPTGVRVIPSTRHTYSDNPSGGSTYHVTVTVDDGFASGSAGLDVTVNNVAPTLAPMPDVSINQGDTLRSTGSFLDPGADTWTGLVDYGDGSGAQPLALNADGTFVLDHVYDEGGEYTVTLSVSDDDGGVGTVTQTVTVNGSLVVHAGPNASLREGDTLTRTGSFSGSPGDTFTATVDYGDGSGVQPLALNPDQTFALSHTYADNGNFTVTVKVTNQAGLSSRSRFTAAVSNAAPVVALGSAVTLNEGDALTRGGSFTDPGADSPWTSTVDYGDGSGVRPLALNLDRTFTLSHTYADNGSYTVTVRVRDKDGGIGTATLTVVVNNLPPAVFVPATASLSEGQTLVTGGSFTDVPADTWTATVDYGDGSGVQSLALNADRTFALSHRYANDGSYTVTVRVTDDDGGVGSAVSIVSVSDVAPGVNPGGDVTINEGDTLTAAGSFTDPGADTWTATVDYGDGSGVQPLTLNPDHSFQLSHVYRDDGAFTITIAVRDSVGLVGTGTRDVTVRNVNPAVHVGNDITLNEGDTLGSAGAFTDPGADSWTATVDYGDGSGAQPLALNPDRTFALSHRYRQDGNYTVTVRVTDDDGGVGTAQFRANVANVPPAVALAAEVTLRAGDALTTPGSFADPGADSWTATVNYGDGSGVQPLPLNADKTFTLNQAYARDGDYSVTVTVRDGGAVPGVGQLRVHVVAVDPTVTLGGPVVLNEGDSLVTGGSFFQPGATAWSATVDYGGGPLPLDLLPDHNFRLEHRYPRFGTFQVTVTVTDQDGRAGSAVLPVRVNNVPPLVRAGGNATLFEGEAFATNVSFQDPGLNTWSATVDYGDGSGRRPVALDGKRFSLAHDYARNGVFTVSVEVADDGGGVGRDVVLLTVVDLPPVLQAAVNWTVGSKGIYVARGLAYDAGRQPVTVAVDFGDGTPAQRVVPGSDRTFTLTHAYAQSGTYQVTIQAQDQDGAVTRAGFTVVVNPTPQSGPTVVVPDLTEQHVAYAEPEAPQPVSSTDETDIVFASFTELAGAPSAGDGLGGGRPASMTDEGDDLFWPWLERKHPYPASPRHPIRGVGDEKDFPDDFWGARELPRPGVATARAASDATPAGSVAVETIPAERADQKVSDGQQPSDQAPVSGQAVQSNTAADRTERPAEGSWWQVLAGCLLAVGGLLGIRSRRRKDREAE
jgi:VCBS repeat-containing protein